METFLIKALQLILSLSLLVFVHELGHFMWAKIFKTRVDKFYLFFHPKFSIFRAKKIKGKWQVRWFAKNLPDHVQPVLDENGLPKTNKKGKQIMEPAPLDQLADDDWRKYPENTEWGIGWLPLGGYCRIAGMVDETTESSQLSHEPQSWEYRAKPAWQRLLIITGGVLNNFIAAFIIYAMILFAFGKEYLPVENAKWGYNYCQTALQNGFQNGDLVLSVDGEKVTTERDILEKIVIEGKCNVTIRRNGNEEIIVLPADFGEQIVAAQEKSFLNARFPFVVESTMVGSPAATINLQKGDSIVALNGKEMTVFQDITEELKLCVDKKVAIAFVRNQQLITDSIAIGSDSKIGVQLMNPTSFFETERQEFGFFAAFPAGFKMGIETLGSYIKQFRLVFTKAGAQSLGGFGAIGNLFPASWDWGIFWNMTAFLSIILAFMNILPIPILDGGYVLFILYEIITRRKPSDKFMDIALNIGMFLMFALLIYANGNDIIRLFK